MANKMIYLFDEGKAEWKDILGGKGANLAEMTRIGLPVPPGFTITTKACNDFYRNGEMLSEEIKSQIRFALKQLEKKTGKILGDTQNPLLVSVRSGAAYSMPGMMDTILNLGMNDDTLTGLSAIMGDEELAYDCYRRFMQMYANVVMGLDWYPFEAMLSQKKEGKAIIAQFKDWIEKQTRKPFPMDPMEQLEEAIKGVFRSWNNQRAKIYRKIHNIPDDLGTAVNVQMMVFGNWGKDSGTGVAFTRNPSTGEKEIFGEFLLDAQGEDIVAGIRTPQPIKNLQENMPQVYQELCEMANLLESHYRDMQDIEFTIERGKLYLLQTRNGKRTAQAAVKIAVDLVREGILSKEEALLRIEPEHFNKLLHRSIDPEQKKNIIGKGLAASPGAAYGKIVFDADRAEQLSSLGEKVILIRPETTPEDIHGMIACQGIITSRGGMTSHAAVVARGLGKPCICGCEEMKINLKKKTMELKDMTFKEGDLLSIDGGTGEIMMGEVKLKEPELSPEFLLLLQWADEVRKMGVRANADTPIDAKKARELGAEGIGLCRTEHMFLDAKRVPIVQQMILADTRAERLKALKQLLPYQINDFLEIFQAMEGFPVTIRLLDPPLHEFLPDLEDLLVEVTRLQADPECDKRERYEKEQLLRKIRRLKEHNPMLGLRGCRLGIIYPEIYDMQIEAIMVAVKTLKNMGKRVYPEIMIPLVGLDTELKAIQTRVEEIGAKYDVEIPVGTMIEIPRAALTADQIAKQAHFFSFGTNDLTQTTMGFSRDDAEMKFMQGYLEQRILQENPFVTLDVEGVGKLIKMAVTLGKSTNPQLKIGICGEHGGDKKSIFFCSQVGVDYLSCSPYRVPLARLSAAQAQLQEQK